MPVGGLDATLLIQREGEGFRRALDNEPRSFTFFFFIARLRGTQRLFMQQLSRHCDMACQAQGRHFQHLFNCGLTH